MISELARRRAKERGARRMARRVARVVGRNFDPRKLAVPYGIDYLGCIILGIV